RIDLLPISSLCYPDTILLSHRFSEIPSLLVPIDLRTKCGLLPRPEDYFLIMKTEHIHNRHHKSNLKSVFDQPNRRLPMATQCDLPRKRYPYQLNHRNKITQMRFRSNAPSLKYLSPLYNQHVG